MDFTGWAIIVILLLIGLFLSTWMYRGPKG